MPMKAISQIAKHEFGHIMGLLHFNQTMEHNFDSVMFPSFSPFDNSTYYPITDYDLAAVYMLYDGKGFSSHLSPLTMDGFGK